MGGVECSGGVGEGLMNGCGGRCWGIGKTAQDGLESGGLRQKLSLIGGCGI